MSNEQTALQPEDRPALPAPGRLTLRALTQIQSRIGQQFRTRLRLSSWARFTPAVVAFALAVLVAADQLAPHAIAAEKPAPIASPPAWVSLFDGETLTNWKSTNFGGEGDVTVADGSIVIAQGSDLTGITWAGGSLPTSNYEVELSAQRVEGGDFFCGLTFPVKDQPCSLIVGGWGGGVVGLSSIDGMDAAHNKTTTYRSFKTGQWYKIRLRVTDTHISAWIDDEQIIDQDIVNRKVSIRVEVDLSRPLGVCTYSTKAALKDFRIRELLAREVVAPAETKKAEPAKK